MTIQLPHLEDYQRFLLDTYIAHQRDTIITVSARRQIGKSIGVEVLLIWAALNQRGLSMYVAPTREQSRKCYNDIIRILQDTILIKKKNDALLQLQLLNGSEILFKSSEQKDGLRGNTVSTVLVIDEASFIPDSTIYELCLPMTNVFRATTILVSTPKWKQGAFYENYMRGMEHLPGFITINYNEWDTSKYLSNENVRKKLRESMKGKNNPWYGKHLSEETREKMRNAKSKKKVVCFETGVIYNSIMDAERKTGIANQCIIAVCKRKRKTAGGYHWKYVEGDGK